VVSRVLVKYAEAATKGMVCIRVIPLVHWKAGAVEFMFGHTQASFVGAWSKNIKGVTSLWKLVLELAPTFLYIGFNLVNLPCYI
jgi:hypothetical protein